MTQAAKLRELPAVHEVVERVALRLPGFPRRVITEETRRELERARAAIQEGGEPSVDAAMVETAVERALLELERPTLRRVINATGVVLHTNLGRAPLGRFEALGGYSNLEYDVATGRRGKRDVHAAALLERLLGAPGIAVNNNAAAVFLALNELGAGGEAIVSRGELIEIGDGFRIPEIMARSGALLREVGTTNRTSLDDYRAAIGERTRLLMRVHPSNFRVSGFTARPKLEELAALGRERGLPVYEDLGSGSVTDLRAFGVDEPLVSGSLRAGAGLVSFSGDKLLGGPQAGILAGKPELVGRVRRNPLFRALRLDKLIYQALGETLRNLYLERWEAIPALRMIRQSAAEVRERAEALAGALPDGLRASIVEGESVIGGGATPEVPIATWLITLNGGAWLEQRLRANNPPVVARIGGNRVLIDLRTVARDEEAELRSAIERAAG